MGYRRTAFLAVVLGAMAMESAVLLGPRRRAQSRRDHEPANLLERPARNLLKEAISIRDQERQRIARDLHDSLGQRVTALRLRVEVLHGGGADADWAQCVEDLLGLTDMIDRELDMLAWDLRPPELEAGLATALQSMVARWSKAYAIRADFQATGVEKPLAPDVETCLYRIAQEALSNVIKHARASRVRVLQEQRTDAVVLIVEDDGCGFDVPLQPGSAAQDYRMGLIDMQERAALMRGYVAIETIQGKGTTVFVRVPTSSATDDPQ